MFYKMETKKNIENKGFLGRGWKFPPTFTKGHNSAELSQFEQDVKESLFILLSTLRGERVMRPDYGTSVHNLIFESLDFNTGTLIADEIQKAILLHEPRVFVDKVEPLQETLNGSLTLSIDYTIIATNTRSNIVYPFYFNEGTNL
jgi:Bacteriophage baseplate protein W